MKSKNQNKNKNKNINENKNKNENRNRNRNRKGGKAIASGGFGCVFSPALRCEGSNKREKGKITKLMTEKHAIQEFEEINKIKEKLKDIKDYKDYFLIDDLTLCKPAKLTQTDLVEYKNKCTALPKEKDSIKKDNINEKLDKLMALNIPDGGKPVDDFIYDDGSFVKMYKLHNKLVELLKNGIVPMNKKNVYHCDLKDSNVLVAIEKDEDNTLLTRIIDWGLSTEYEPFKDNEFPNVWRNRPLQYNTPFSVIIFSDAFVNKYTKYIQDGGEVNKTDLKPFVLDYIHYWIKERGAGHYKFINEIMYMLFSNDLRSLSEDDLKIMIENEFTLSYITNYIVDVLLHFTHFRENGTLNLRVYLDNIFIDIVDKWGFITIYFPFLELLHSSYDNLTKEQIEIFNKIKDIFINYLYNPRIKPIDMNDLYKELDKLGNLIKSQTYETKVTGVSAKGLNKRKKISRKKGITGKTFVPNNTKRIFTKKPKSKTRRFKHNKLFLVSAKLKKI